MMDFTIIVKVKTGNKLRSVCFSFKINNKPSIDMLFQLYNLVYL